MSFDVFLQRFEYGASAAVRREAVREVLGRASCHGPDEFGFYLITFPEGVEVEFSARGLESDETFTGCAFHIGRFGDGLMKFILDVARAGDMVIVPAMEGNPLILVSKDQQFQVPPEVLEQLRPVVVESSGEL